MDILCAFCKKPLLSHDDTTTLGKKGIVTINKISESKSDGLVVSNIHFY